jgi:hypothetical protein
MEVVRVSRRGSRDDSEEVKHVKANARQEIEDRLRYLIYDEPHESASLERDVEEWMADVPRWVKAGHGQPGLCKLTYPQSLLREALPDLLTLRDRDCSEVLLGVDWQPPPKHLCFNTAVAGTRKYARHRFPPRNLAQEMWINEWPFPVGESRMRDFVTRAGLDRAELPPAPDQDNPDAAIGLWVEQHFSEYSRLTVLGYCQEVKLSRRYSQWNLAQAAVIPMYVSRVARSWSAGDVDDEWTPDERDREQEKKELSALISRGKLFFRFFERGALRYTTETRGRPPGSRYLAIAREYYAQAVAEMYRAIGESAPLRADLLDAYRTLSTLEGSLYDALEDGHLWDKSVFYHWLEGTSPDLPWPPPPRDSV